MGEVPGECKCRCTKQLALNGEVPGECTCRCTRQLALNGEVPGECNCRCTTPGNCLCIGGGFPQDNPVGHLHRFCGDAQ